MGSGTPRLENQAAIGSSVSLNPDIKFSSLQN
jgi:hypothetical protein